MVFEPLEPATTPAADVPADPSFVPPPPPIRRDDELPAVTGEIGFDMTAPEVPQFDTSQPAPDPPPPAAPRRRFRRQSRGTETVSTKTSGGTIVTFPPQNAPGSGPGEIGRITSSVPAVAPAPPPPPTAEAPGAQVDPMALATPPLADPPAERAGFLVAPAAEDRLDAGRGSSDAGPWLLIDPEEIDPQVDVDLEAGIDIDVDTDTDAGIDSGIDIGTEERVSEESDAEDEDLNADLEYLFAAHTIDVGPIDLDAARGLSEPAPVVEDHDLIDAAQPLAAPEEPSVPQALQPPEPPEIPEVPQVREALQSPQLPEAPEAPQVPETLQSPQLLEAPEAPQVPGLLEIPETPQVPELPEPPEVPQVPETPQVPEARLISEPLQVPEVSEPAETLDAPETAGGIPEVQSASIVEPPVASAVAYPVADRQAVDEPEPELDFDATDDLDDLLAEFSAAMAPTEYLPDPPVPPVAEALPTVETPQAAPSILEQPAAPSVGRFDVAVPSAEVVDHAAALEQDQAPLVDPAPVVDSAPVVDPGPASVLGDTLGPTPDVDPALNVAPPASPPINELLRHAPPSTEEAKTPSWIPEKTEAEVFASVTSPLPARTRRGDHRLIDASPEAGFTLPVPGEGPPTPNLVEDVALPKSDAAPGQRFKRVLILLHVLAVLGGGLYVALNTFYL